MTTFIKSIRIRWTPDVGIASACRSSMAVDDVALAVAGQDVVIYLAFVIPRLSVTGVNSEDRPDWALRCRSG